MGDEVEGLDRTDGDGAADERRAAEDDDEVDEASEESFPASDAPQSWAGPADG